MVILLEMCYGYYVRSVLWFYYFRSVSWLLCYEWVMVIMLEACFFLLEVYYV